MSQLMATLLGLYLIPALLPAWVAWRRGLPAATVNKSLLYGVLLGWTVAGWLIAWWHALDDRLPSLEFVSNVSAQTSDSGCRAAVTITIQENDQSPSVAA